MELDGPFAVPPIDLFPACSSWQCAICTTQNTIEDNTSECGSSSEEESSASENSSEESNGKSHLEKKDIDQIQPKPNSNNGSATEGKDPLCKLCRRPCHPKWLYLNNSTEKIFLGHRVFFQKDGIHNHCGVVTSINVYQNTITVHILLEPSYRRKKIDFVATTYSPSDFKNFETLPPHSSYQSILDRFGVCKNCKKAYIIENSYNFLQFGQASIAKEKILQEQKETIELLDNEKAKKVELQELDRYDEIIQCSSNIKQINLQLMKLKRLIEPSQIWCPFCSFPPDLDEKISSN